MSSTQMCTLIHSTMAIASILNHQDNVLCVGNFKVVLGSDGTLINIVIIVVVATHDDTSSTSWRHILSTSSFSMVALIHSFTRVVCHFTTTCLVARSCLNVFQIYTCVGVTSRFYIRRWMRQSNFNNQNCGSLSLSHGGQARMSTITHTLWLMY